MSPRAYPLLLIAQKGHVATITFNQPEKKNLLTQNLIAELLQALDCANTSDDVRVVVLTGAGDAFSAGADLKGMTPERRHGSPGVDAEFDDLLLRLDTMTKPVVARIPGYVMGGAMGIVACCHFAVACESAVFATPEIKRGLFPMIIMAALQRVVPRRELLKLMLLGEHITAQQAKQIGLVSEVVSGHELDARVLELANQLVQLPPNTMRMGLEAWHAQRELSLKDAVPELRERLYKLLASDEAKEGLTAFFENRAPRWTPG